MLIRLEPTIFLNTPFGLGEAQFAAPDSGKNYSLLIRLESTGEYRSVSAKVLRAFRRQESRARFLKDEWLKRVARKNHERHLGYIDSDLAV